MDPAERGIWWVSKMLGAGVVSPLRGVNGIGWLLGAEGSVMQRKQCTDTGLCVQLRTAAESQAEALNLPELFYVLYLFFFFFPVSRRFSYSAFLTCSRQERLRQLLQQVFLRLCAGFVTAGDRNVPPKKAGKKLWGWQGAGGAGGAVSGLSLGMEGNDNRQVVYLSSTHRPSAPQGCVKPASAGGFSVFAVKGRAQCCRLCQAHRGFTSAGQQPAPA